MQKPLIFIILFTIVISVVIAIGLSYASGTLTGMLNKDDFSEHTIYVHDDVAIRVIVANTAIEKQTGLSNRKMIAPGQGMLFIFDKSQKWRIWMKDMNFGIDIIWLDESGRVVDIRDHVYPDTYSDDLPEVFVPRESSRYIIEVLAGFAETSGITVGDLIQLGDVDVDE